MPKKILEHAKVSPAVGQGVPTAMPQHMRVYVPKPSLLPCGGDQVVDRMPGKRRSALRHKQPGQSIMAAYQMLTDST